jgi:GNAT superfamily N-acetyltransferase
MEVGMQLLSNIASSGREIFSPPMPRRDSSGALFTKLDLLSHPLESSDECERHLLRLTSTARRQRFNGSVDDAFIRDYVKTRVGHCARVIAARFAGIVRGVAELHPLDGDGRRAEAAFSVEHHWQGLGVGTGLMLRLVDEAIVRGFREIILCYDALNTRMQSIYLRFGGRQVYSDGEYVATIDLSHFSAPIFEKRADRWESELQNSLTA